ncbi:riboflavin biosynthesis protein RibF [Ureaplasma diversum]|uniref:Riboflavin biosynthesis protein n=1 Tax=Ureaplasma diversum NCTC 246 TaxID=1188241 RepID=A0A084F0N1_9BACT|nr:riboflavin biosynthesis protein RibF [Ureaplasma diversum]KEZ23773.1 Riboflavin biosynthesis protein [Ureaplasma diversum NCTC 246]
MSTIFELNKTNLKSIKQLNLKKLVIGFFDGLHLGHLKLFNLNNHSETTNDYSVLTFYSIPRKTNYLFSFNERIKQLEKIGIKNILVFDLEANNMNGFDFINQYLNELNIESIIVGENFSFGKDQLSATSLKQQAKANVEIVQIDQKYASSKIKAAILENDFKTANELLGFAYYRTNQVVLTSQVGRLIGFPTANIELEPNLINLNSGSYVSSVVVDQKTYLGVSYIGIPKTIKSRVYSMIEVHILDFNQDIYYQPIQINFHQFLAVNQRFSCQESLIEHIKNCIEQTKEFFKNEPSLPIGKH